MCSNADLSASRLNSHGTEKNFIIELHLKQQIHLRYYMIYLSPKLSSLGETVQGQLIVSWDPCSQV